MKQDDDFELNLNGEDEEETAEIPMRDAPQRAPFDWAREDPHDFAADQLETDAHSSQPAPLQDAGLPAAAAAPAAVPAPVPQAPFAQQTSPAAGARPAPAAAPSCAAEAPCAPTPAPSVAAAAGMPYAAPVQPAVPARQANGMTVLISGGDRGIGAAAARLFWQAGYRTAIFYYKNEDAARALINELGSDCVAVRCDVASREACEAAYRVVVRTFGDPDVLICNAGIAQQKLFTEITEEEWQRMVGVDLSGAFHLCQLVLPAMIRRKYGRILTVSSMWGQTGGSCEVHYSAAKAGLIGLTKALAKEEGPSGITVNCVAPGVIDTDMMANFSAEDKQALAQETPVARLGSAGEVAQTLLFLAAREAGYITGQVLGVNGGLVI